MRFCTWCLILRDSIREGTLGLSRAVAAGKEVSCGPSFVAGPTALQMTCICGGHDDSCFLTPS